MKNITPQEYQLPLYKNPCKGWVQWGENLTTIHAAECQMVFVLINWAEIETSEDNYNWEHFEQMWNIDFKIFNRFYVFRFVLDYPSQEKNENKYQWIPNWLIHSAELTGLNYDDANIGKGYSPDYTNKQLIKKHEHFISAIAKRYDHIKQVAFIEVGSLGHWGEWHTWPKGSGEFPKYKIAEKYLQQYALYFKHTFLLVRRPLTIQAKHTTIGLYNDLLGDSGTWGVESWLSWIANGYKSEWDLGKHPALATTWWHTAPCGGELAWNDQGNEYYFHEDHFPFLLKHIKDCHISWIGPNNPLQLYTNPLYKKQLDDLYIKMGYRFIIKSVSIPECISRHEPFTIIFSVLNTGVAPFYFNWNVSITLHDASHSFTYDHIENSIDIRTWIPGIERNHSVTIHPPHTFPKHLQSCYISFSIACPDKQHQIAFANSSIIKRDDFLFTAVKIPIE